MSNCDGCPRHNARVSSSGWDFVDSLVPYTAAAAILLLVMLDPWSHCWKIEGTVESTSHICMDKLVWYLCWRAWELLMCWRRLLGPLLLLPVIIIAVASSTVVALSDAVASSAASVGLLMHCIQCGRYCLLDLLLDAGAHAMDLHLHTVDGGLAIFQC